MQEEAYVEELFAVLAEYKGLLAEVTEGLDGQQLYQNLYMKYNLDYTNKKKAELVGREKDQVCQRVLAFLERFGQELKLENIREAEDAFAHVKELFAHDRDAYERQQQDALQIVESVFDFLEGAFGNSQEMVMFITELNSNAYCVSFLQDCECERYYQYNKELLFDEKRRKLLERMG